MVTNGTHMNDEIIYILQEYDKYIREWHRKINEIEFVENEKSILIFLYLWINIMQIILINILNG